jgi:CRP/FNR family transcriptional regulator, cyclic AMP receptor protein
MAGKDPKVDLISSVSLFKGLDRRELEQVASLVDEVDLPAGKTLMTQGETGEEMFVIVSGRVGIDRDGRRINERGPGSVIGELALLSKGPRTATITTLEPTQVLLVGHREFHALMDDHPKIRMGVLSGVADKIRVLDQASIH